MDGISAREKGVQKSTPSAVQSMHGLTLFRGLAILQIAFLHASHALFLRGLPGPSRDDDPIFVSIDIGFHGSTIYFAMISGFLYQHIFAGRPYLAYLRSRLERVAIPYCVVTIALTLAQHPKSLLRLSPELLETLMHNLLTGATWNTLWYIPILLAIYVLAPPLAAMLCQRTSRPAGFLMMLAPLVISRSGTDPSLSNLIYFAGAFVVGIEFCRAHIDFGRSELLIFALLVAATTTVLLVSLFAADRDFMGPVSLRETLFYVQKLALGTALLCCTFRLAAQADHVSSSLTLIANCSFGIYFLHGPLMRLTAKAIGPYLDGNDLEYLCGIILILMIALGASLLIILVLRRLLGRGSRWIIGA